MSRRRIPIAAVVVFTLATIVLLPTWLVADEPHVSWRVPDQFPTGLELPVVADLKPNADGVAFWLKTPGQKPIAAQRDSLTNGVRFLTRVEQASPGKTVRFGLSRYEGKPTVRIVKQKGGLQFHDGDRPVMFYQREPKSLDGSHERANYIHPLLGLDGDALFVVRQAEVVDQGPVFATLKLLVHWVSPLITENGERKPIVEETTIIRLFHATQSSQCIDFEIRLKPMLPDVKIGGSENVKGYSGFTVRIKPPQGLAIIDAAGRLTSDGVGRVTPWADASGRYGSDERVSGIAILCHPSLPVFPPRWVLRHYGMQNVAYPGREPVPLSADEPLVLRHRLVIHRGDVTSSRIADHQQAYAVR